VIFPENLKLLQGALGVVISFIGIVQYKDLINLSRDFTALYFVSEIDNVIFNVCTKGYFGTKLKQSTGNVTEVMIAQSDSKDKESCCFTSSNRVKLIILYILSSNVKDQTRRLSVRSTPLALILQIWNFKVLGMKLAMAN
jgi:hypothetical protein